MKQATFIAALKIAAAVAIYVLGWGWIASSHSQLWQRVGPQALTRFVDDFKVTIPVTPKQADLVVLCDATDATLRGAEALGFALPRWQRERLARCASSPQPADATALATLAKQTATALDAQRQTAETLRDELAQLDAKTNAVKSTITADPTITWLARIANFVSTPSSQVDTNEQSTSAVSRIQTMETALARQQQKIAALNADTTLSTI